MIFGLPYPKVVFWIDRVTYWRTGWFGCQLESREFLRPPAGTRRILFNREFTVFTTRREGFYCRITWTMTRLSSVNTDKANIIIREFVNDLRDLVH